MQEQKFDMEDYIKQRLAEIRDTDERSFAREILLKGFLPAVQVMEERYRSLEERVRREIEIPGSRYTVYTTVIRRRDYDASNSTWFPVCSVDAEPDRTACRRIYFRGNEGEKRRFEQQEFFTAVDAMGQPRQVAVRRTEDYRRAVEELYGLFVYNRVPWNTVNTGDLDRFYDVYPVEDADASGEGEASGGESTVVSVRPGAGQDLSGKNFPGDGSDGTESMDDWEIDFGEWNDRIGQDYMALWNLEYFTFRSMKFMVPCIDGKYYEHELNLKEYAPDCGYMVKGNEDILSIRREEGRIIMVSLKESFQEWQACRFGKRPDTDSYGYSHRILSNERKEHFVDHLAVRYGQGIHSRTELFRFVEELDTEGRIRLRDCRIREKEQPDSCPADMNWFLREDVFPMETRKVLELTFERNTEAVGTGETAEREPWDPDGEDMLRYIISQIQLLFDEYRCVGILHPDLSAR